MANIENGKSNGSKAFPPLSSLMAEASTWPVKVMADALIRRPKNIAPESPIKICAGWKLCGKNPRHRPITTAVIRDGAPARFKPLTTANKYEKAKNEAAQISTIPVANPSNPSTKLMAFITTITNKTVSTCPILVGKVVIPLIGNHKI